MTYYYESFLVRPYGWDAWVQRYPGTECKHELRVFREFVKGEWKWVIGSNFNTLNDDVITNASFDKWQDAVSFAHDHVSTKSRSVRFHLTWPEYKARVESNREAVLF